MNTATRTCTDCGAEKALEDFYRRAAGTERRFAHCKDCAKRRVREYRRVTGYRSKHPNSPASQRKAYLKANYGISPEQYDEMVNRQDGRCAICKRLTNKRLVVDHDHDNGQVRAIAYLKRWK